MPEPVAPAVELVELLEEPVKQVVEVAERSRAPPALQVGLLAVLDQPAELERQTKVVPAAPMAAAVAVAVSMAEAGAVGTTMAAAVEVVGHPSSRARPRTNSRVQVAPPQTIPTLAHLNMVRTVPD